ncbi:methyl-accepting chemotaxis protein [Aneurinibacillus soli]|uniref:Methyl-accepting chemotaxis protein McpB n=1 Tax=Aneurinibacillus soli TaxID=1500254 RepID=A0A0U5B259_9BACL|nr:methyl-accepting chemotaxis protein [Aneurinibacillus soli]PYE63676.1 methyl-accepting chemotaxis protein [Aneurinibacillus soli]BAU27391.1 Methyl-accepting chemotaxis protein McpB [Aneurinibacillus soli]
MTISKKLIGSFLLIAILLGITSSISFYYLKKIDSSYTDLVDRRALILSNAQKIQVEAAKQNNNLQGYLLTEDENSLKDLNTAHQNIDDLIGKTSQLVQHADDKKRLVKLEELNKQLKQKYDQLLQISPNNQNSNELTDFFKKEIQPIEKQLEPVADEIVNAQQKLMDEGSTENTETVNSAVTHIVLLSVIAFISALLIGFFTSRIISRPIVHMSKIAKKIALGDLTTEDIHVKNRDEIGALAESFNQMTENLRQLIRQISISAGYVTASSEELTASAEQSSKASETITLTIQEVAIKAEKQAHGVEESVQAINEMSSGIQQIAANAQMTSSLSIQTSQKAAEGNQAIQVTTKQMDSIYTTMNQLANVIKEMDEHSGEIEQIVKVMSEIAAQTNLLALNAAIEAARAGEHGRGFAVVADEVRQLAEKSSESAEQITQLITTIQKNTHNAVESMSVGTKEVDAGIRVVHTAGELFKEITHFVGEVTNQTQEVSAASQQISANTAQVVHLVDLISEEAKTVIAGSQNVSAASEEQLASVEEISSSAASLSKMAEELQALIGKFKV